MSAASVTQKRILIKEEEGQLVLYVFPPESNLHVLFDFVKLDFSFNLYLTPMHVTVLLQTHMREIMWNLISNYAVPNAKNWKKGAKKHSSDNLLC